MYKILIKTCSASNNIWNFYQEDGVDYVAASLEDMKPTALTLLKKYGKKNIKIIDQMSGQDMDNADVYIYDSTDNYEELSNRPSINGIEIIGQLSLEELGIQPAGEYATEAYVQEMMSNIEMPDVDLTGYATEEYVDNAIKEIDDNTIVVRLEKTTSSQTDAQKAIIQEVLPLLTSKNIIIQLYEKPATTQSYVDMIYRTFYWRPLLIEDISTYTGSLYWYGEASPSIHILNDMAYNSKTQPYIIIKVENGIVTNIDGLGGGSAQYQASTEIDLLTKRYNKSWTPTQDYNPVHKKYVDDAVANINIPEVDLTDYATTQYVDDSIANIDIPETNLEGYATEEYVANAIEGYATTDYVDEKTKSFFIQAEKFADFDTAATVEIFNQWIQDYRSTKNLKPFVIRTKNRNDAWKWYDFRCYCLTRQSEDKVTNPIYYISFIARRYDSNTVFYTLNMRLYTDQHQVTEVSCNMDNSYIQATTLSQPSLTNYLSKTNTTEYTPANDYNPATKKYVDDSVAAIPVYEEPEIKTYYFDWSDLVEINQTMIGSYTVTLPEKDIERLTNIINEEIANGFNRNSMFICALKFGNLAIGDTTKASGVSGGHYCINMRTITGANDMMYKYANIDFDLYIYTTYNSDTKTVTLTGQMNVTPQYNGSVPNYYFVNNNFLSKTNTSSFTPTANYHPATKKYVDDAVAGVSGGSGGGADLTNYYTKAEVDALLQELRNEFVSANNNINDKLETIIYGGE